MKILILGGNGMLGHKLVQVLSQNFDVWTTIRKDFTEVERFGLFDKARTVDKLDAENISELRTAIETVRPDVVINAVGVIKQLPSSKDVITTLSINSILPHRLHQLSGEFGYRLFCISTDCVFSGESGNYAESDRADAFEVRVPDGT